MSIKNKIAAVACGLALAGTVAMPVAALADGGTGDATTPNNTGTTNVRVMTDPESTQLTFSVPTEINFAVAADGTLRGPSERELKIVNKSVFGIHVATMQVVNGDNWHVVSDVTDSAVTTGNNIQFKVNGVAASNTAQPANWDMQYAGANGDSVELNVTDGKVSKVTDDLSKTAVKAATITWTLAAGNAQ